MKTPRVILKGLISGRVKLTPELIEILKKHRDGQAPLPQDAPSGDEPHGSRPSETAPAAGADSSGARHRMIFASPIAGRWICRFGLLMVCACLMLPTLARAAGTDSTFDEANRAFAAGNMSAAARGYQSLLVLEGYSAPVLFNLANAQLRDGQLGAAILNYERAQWLAPNDPDITANLEFARRKAGLPAEPPARLESGFSIFTLNTWAGIAAVMALLIAGLPLAKRLLPAYRFAWNGGQVIACLALLIAIAGVCIRWPVLDRAIVTAPETAARVSPVTVIQPLFTLHAGEMVTVKKVHAGFALVTNSQGHEGWVSREALANIVPSA